MNLVSKVSFAVTTQILYESYTPAGHFAGQREYFKYVKDFDQFRKLIVDLTNSANAGVNKLTYKISVKRNVIVSDQDDMVTRASMVFPDKSFSIILCTTGKLLYVKDVEQMLKHKFHDFEFNPGKFARTDPIYLESFDGRNVKYRFLSQDATTNDIVVDSNLNQIWPVATGKPPVMLVELLNKTTETVR